MFSDEQRVVKNVVNCVMKEMNKVPLEVAKHPVGLDEAVRNFDMIALQSGGSIQIVGIWGMGGSGKTTLAKEIFNKRCLGMNWFSFLSDVRDAHKKGLLLEKQKTLLKDLDVKDVCFDNVDQGKQILKSRLRSVSVLIILDDVDHIDQLDALLPPRESLGRGSLIIVTTRELDVLKGWGISAIYEMRALNATHAEQLFCWHAFLQPRPLSGFQDLVAKFLNACCGLPLSLKVLGAQLYGRSDRDYWQRMLNKFSRILPKDITERLKVSYDALDEEEKEMFLDTACFFIGERISLAIAVWEGSDWDGVISLERLVNKCLVEVDDYGDIRMHDHLRDLGRDIADRQSPYRLWSPRQTIHPQQEGLQIRGMVNANGDNCYCQEGEITVSTSQGYRCLMPCSLGLKIFVGDGDFINQEYSDLSRELIWLQCERFKHPNIPSWLSLQKLRILELFNPQNLEDLWERDVDAPLELRELVIKRDHNLRGFPRSITNLKHLKKILIDGHSGTPLSNLPQEFCFLQSLEHLDIIRCTNLSSLPSHFGELTNLQHLNLNGCTKLKMLPHSLKKLTLLEYLNLEGCEELTIKSELHILEDMTKLRYLNLDWCRKLEELRLPNGASLTELYLQGTSLKELPANIFQLTKLTKLVIGGEFWTTLPTSLGNLSSLTTLKIQGCGKLESLPDSLEHLNFLTDLYIKQSGVKWLPKSFIHLQNLEVHDTPVSELSFGLGCKLKKIDLRSTKVSKISINGDCCPFLETLILEYDKDLRELETLPTTLKTITIYHCNVLKNVRGVCGLENLQNLQIYNCEELYGLPSFAELASLKKFELQKCKNLKKIGSLERLRSLKEVRISDCPELEALPSLTEISSLKEFKLEKCHKLEKVEGLESLRSLEMLRIDGCAGLDGLSSLADLTSLREFELRMCHKLVKVDGIEQLRALEKLEVHNCWKMPCIRFEQCERLRSLVVVANDKSDVELFISKIQKWPSEVIICTRAMLDVGWLKYLFELPNVSVLDYSDVDEIGPDGTLALRPESSVNADAILICFIIDCVHPHIDFIIVPERGGCFNTELGKGKWVWMGVFTQGSDWLRSNEEILQAFSEENHVNDEVDEAWLVMGEKVSIVEAFRQLFTESNIF